MAVPVSEKEIRRLVNGLRGLAIWFVNVGGAAGASFPVSLGKKIPRDVPLNNPSVTQEFKEFRGEASLYVWCSWRLELESKRLMVSSDQEQLGGTLNCLIGERVSYAKAFGAAHDLVIVAGEYRLHVFCDRAHGSGGPNWELVLSNSSVAVGPGFEVEIEG